MTERRAPVSHPPLPTHVQDGAVAVVAARGEQVVVVLLAVGLPVALKEVAGADLVLAVGADEVLGVPRPPHRRHHLQEQSDGGGAE